MEGTSAQTHPEATKFERGPGKRKGTYRETGNEGREGGKIGAKGRDQDGSN